MSGKKVTFAAKRPSQAVPSNIDQWVEKRDGAPTALASPPPDIKMKRLTIDVSPSLHKRIKSQCALQNLVMADEIRDLLEQHFRGQGASS